MSVAILHLSETARLTAPPAPPWQRAPPLAHVKLVPSVQLGMRLGKGCIRLAPEVLFQVCVPIHARVLLVLYLHTSPKHIFVCTCEDPLFAVINSPKIIIIPDIVVDLCSNIFRMRQLLSDGCASLQSRRDSLSAASRLGHRCPPPLRFHHVGWQSLGVRPRPCLAPFARHVEDIFFLAARIVPFFIYLRRVRDCFFFPRICITNSYL